MSAVFVASAAADEALSLFVFPDQASTYVYVMQDGVRLYSHVTSCGDNYVEVEDAIVFPEEVASNSDPIVQDRYKIRLDDGKAIKESTRGNSILLKQPLTAGDNGWSVEGVSFADGKKQKYVSTCRIASIEDMAVIGQRTSVITVECEADVGDLEVHSVTRYARGIGLIERATTTMTENGESYGTQSIKLAEIVADQS